MRAIMTTSDNLDGFVESAISEILSRNLALRWLLRFRYRWLAMAARFGNRGYSIVMFLLREPRSSDRKRKTPATA